MKILFFYIALIILLSCSQNESRKIMSENDYVGMRVQEFLDSKEEKYIDYQFIDEPPGNLIGCQFIYDDNIKIVIYVDSLKYLEKFDVEMQWDIEKFKKETISKIKMTN